MPISQLTLKTRLPIAPVKLIPKLQKKPKKLNMRKVKTIVIRNNRIWTPSVVIQGKSYRYLIRYESEQI